MTTQNNLNWDQIKQIISKLDYQHQVSIFLSVKQNLQTYAQQQKQHIRQKPPVPTYDQKDPIWTNNDENFMIFEDFKYQENTQSDTSPDTSSKSSDLKQEQSKIQLTPILGLSSHNKKKYDILISIIDQIISQIPGNLEGIQQESNNICYKIVKSDIEIIKSKNYESIAGAIIVHASRKMQKPLTSRCVQKYIGCKEKTLNKMFMLLKQNIEELNSPMPTPYDFVPAMIQNLNLNQKLEKITYQIIQNMGCIVNGELSATVAACAIKFAALLNGIDLSVNYMAKMNQISPHSIRILWKNCINCKLQIAQGLDQSLYCMQPQFVC